MIHFLAPRDNDFTIREWLARSGRGLAGRISIVNYEDLPSRRELPPGTYVLAGLDQLHPAGLRFVSRLREDLLRSGGGARVLNSPEETLLRLPLLEELHRLGLNPHRAVRADRDLQGLRFPVFLRQEHWHSGSLTPLLASRSELDAALARAVVRGHRLKDLLVVEFCETAGPDGLYRKYAAFIVGSEIIPRHLSHGPGWMIKFAGKEITEARVLEERAYVFENPHERELRRIFGIARTEYGRIDYSVRDGAVVTWEINLCPTIGGSRASSGTIAPELQPLRQAAKEHFARRFQAAFEAVDTERDSPGPIPLRGEPGPPPQPRDLVRQRSGERRSVARILLRPLRQPIDRLAGALSPVLVRLARRFP